tara:strand:+ start:548 stop:1168 length:621 start_codon:yes stop_codon:yes gene_type:complete
MATTTLTQGIEEYETDITFGNGIDVTGTGTFSDSITGTGLLHSFGTRKIQTFVGTLAATDTGSAYADGDVLVELGTLDTSAPSGIVTGTKFFIHRALIGITTAAGQTLIGSLQLSATSGTATNAAVASGTEIVGAGVTSFNEQLSATQSITEVDINFNNTAGNYHIFVPNVTAAIASKYLYAAATTTLNADATAGRFTVELEYSVY